MEEILQDTWEAQVLELPQQDNKKYRGLTNTICQSLRGLDNLSLQLLTSKVLIINECFSFDTIPLQKALNSMLIATRK